MSSVNCGREHSGSRSPVGVGEGRDAASLSNPQHSLYDVLTGRASCEQNAVEVGDHNNLADVKEKQKLYLELKKQGLLVDRIQHRIGKRNDAELVMFKLHVHAPKCPFSTLHLFPGSGTHDNYAEEARGKRSPSPIGSSPRIAPRLHSYETAPITNSPQCQTVQHTGVHGRLDGDQRCEKAAPKEEIASSKPLAAQFIDQRVPAHDLPAAVPGQVKPANPDQRATKPGLEREETQESSATYDELGDLSQYSRPRQWAIRFCASPDFEMVVVIVIFANCVTLAMFNPLQGEDEGMNKIIGHIGEHGNVFASSI